MFRLAFVAVILIAILMRFVGLDSWGMGFFRDEAALGYNSWSIAKTGADEFGQKWPVVFRSFEVFFLPAYEYMTAALMSVAGLSVWSTRAVAAASGVWLVIVSVFLIKEISNNKWLALTAGFMIAIVPWSVYFSRGAFEGNLALAFLATGVFLIIRAHENKGKWWPGLLVMTAAMYSYQAERLIVPLWSLIVVSSWCGRDFRRWKQVLVESIPAIILGLPLIWVWFTPAGLHRAAGVSLLSHSGLVDPTPWQVMRKIVAMYISYFSPHNLFWLPDFDRQRSLVGMSVFYWWWIPLYVVGVIRVIGEIRGNKGWKWIVILMLIAPLPAAVTADPFHTYRSLVTYWPQTLVLAVGLFKMWPKQTVRRILMGAVIAGFSVYGITSWISSYVYVTPYERGFYWDQSFDETVEFVEGIKSEKEKIVWDTGYSEPYIQYLFWTRYNPRKLHEVTRALPLDYYGSGERVRFDHLENVYFEEVDWPTRRGDRGTVFVMPAERLPVSEFVTDPIVKLLKEIKFKNGQTSFRIVEIVED